MVESLKRNIIFVLVFAVFVLCLFSDLLKVKHTEASLLGLPEPTAMLSVSDDYTLPILKGLKFNSDNVFDISFVVDSGSLSKTQLKDPRYLGKEIKRIVDYFLAALMVDESQLWVNLSPYEQNRILDDELVMTELGRDMLAQDYLLKQLSSSLTNPKTDIGQKYWNVASKSSEMSKIWIKPDKAEIVSLPEKSSVFVSHATLKVESEDPQRFDFMSEVLNEEINEGNNFSRLRQIYNSLILAKWFKQYVESSVYVKRINSAKFIAKEQIYKLYKKSFESGVYDLIKEEQFAGSQVDRRYYCGGLIFHNYKLSSSVAADVDLIDVEGSLFLIDTESRNLNNIDDDDNQSWEEANDNIFNSKVCLELAEFLSGKSLAYTSKSVYEDIRGGSVQDLDGSKRVRKYRLGKIAKDNNIFYMNEINWFEQHLGAKYLTMRVLEKYGIGAQSKIMKINGKRYLVQKHIGGETFSSVGVTADKARALGYSLGLLHRHGLIHGDLYANNDDERIHGIYRHVIFKNVGGELVAQMIDTGFSRRAVFLSVLWERFGVRDLLLENTKSNEEFKKIDDSFTKAYRQAYKDVKLLNVVNKTPYWASAYQVIIEPLISVGVPIFVLVAAFAQVVVFDTLKEIIKSKFKSKPNEAQPQNIAGEISVEENLNAGEVGGIDFKMDSFGEGKINLHPKKKISFEVIDIKQIENYSDLLIYG